MPSSQTSTDAPSRPDSTESSDEATNVFAASAAEGALLDSKSSRGAEPADDLEASLNRAADSLSSTKLSDATSAEPEPASDSAAAATTTTAEEKATSASSSADLIPSPEQLERELDADLNLSKEEMIEAALDCPCIASMKEGPCGTSFISAYRCFLESESEPRGMECIEQFREMQTCIADHPDEYNFDADDEQQQQDEQADGAEQRQSAEQTEQPTTTSTHSSEEAQTAASAPSAVPVAAN